MKDEKSQAIDHSVITAASIIDPETFMFVVQGSQDAVDENGKSIWNEDTPPSKIVIHNIKKNTWGWLLYKNAGFPSGNIAGGYINGKTQALAVNHMAQVAYFEFTSGIKASELDIDLIYSAPQVQLIDSHFYVPGDYRRIAKRLKSNKWQEYTPDPKLNDESDPNDAKAFRWVAGFNEQDIYVCGGAYNLWHFNSNNWTRMDAPYDWWMRTLYCGDDGLVYIGGAGGQLLMGNKDKGWTEIVKSGDKPSIGDINFVAQYKGIVYAMTDSYLWELDLENSCWKPVIFEGDIIPNQFGYLSVKDDLMMVAGPYEAAVWDGKTWIFLIGEGVGATDLVMAQILKKESEDLEKIRDDLYLLKDD